MTVPCSVAEYLALVTSEHSGQPNYTATLTAYLQGFSDEQCVLAAMPLEYDLDVAVGAQLDTVGLWAGQSRYITTPLVGVYFAWATVGVGWNQGTWCFPLDPTSGLSVLPDDAYRTLLRAKIAANQWDGTVPQAYAIWDVLFAGTGYGILIQDNQNMTMEYALTGPVPDAVTLALFENGYLSLKPVGVRINNFWTPSVPDTPYFGWGVENSSISGWGVGAWGILSPGV